MPNNLNQVHNTLNHTIFLQNFLLLKNSLIVSIMLVQFNNLSFCCVNVVFIKTCYVMNPHSLSKQIQENKIFNKSSDFQEPPYSQHLWETLNIEKGIAW